MKVPLIRIPISTRAYEFLLYLPVFLHSTSDAAVSRAAAALADARVVTRGKGTSYVVETDPEAAGVIWQQCLAAEGRADRGKHLSAALRDLVIRINHEVRAVGYTYPTTESLPEPRRVPPPVQPGEVRRNLTLLPASRAWRGVDADYAITAGPGEPTRTAADMRVAIADQMERYLALYPFDSGPVDQATIAATAAMIVADHYTVACHVLITRDHLRKYVEVAGRR